jgi:hypothetical protein
MQKKKRKQRKVEKGWGKWGKNENIYIKKKECTVN